MKYFLIQLAIKVWPLLAFENMFALCCQNCALFCPKSNQWCFFAWLQWVAVPVRYLYFIEGYAICSLWISSKGRHIKVMGLKLLRGTLKNRDIMY